MMPDSALDLAMGDHLKTQNRVDANKMAALTASTQGLSLSANCSSIRETSAMPLKATDLNATSDSNVCSRHKSTCENPQDGISNVAKRRTQPRSVSESECENLSRSIPPYLNRKDEPNDGNTPVDSPDLQLLNKDFDELPFSDEVKLPVPPDGGWGWVIVAASFVCCAVVDGMCSVFGILLPELVIYFEETSSKVSLAGSVLAGCFLLLGPVASIIINCLGCRCSTIAGGILCATALIASTWSPSIVVFILVFGGLGGLGLGLIYLPASVMVGFYFERRRGLAAGMSTAGSGVGMLILSPLAAFLVVQYGWKGCLFIMAGICLQCLLCGALMRPLLPTLTVLQPNAFLNEDNKETNVTESEPVSSRYVSSLAVIKENALLNGIETEKIPAISVTSENASNSKLSADRKLSLAGDNVLLAKQPSTTCSRVAGIHSCLELANQRGSFSSVRSPKQRSSEDRTWSANANCLSCQELTSSSGKARRGSLLGSRSRRSSSILADPVVTPLMKKDVFYSGSIASLHNSMSWMTKGANVPSLPELYHPTVYVQKSLMSRAVHIFKEMLDVSIMINLAFVVICAANVFIQLGYFVPIVFLPAYGLSLGLTPTQAATLLAMLGLSNMFGRAIAGALASLRCINGLHLNNISLICAGISTGFLVFCTTYELLLAYTIIFGLCIAGFVPMTTIFLVKYVGLDKLTNSFGLLSMIKGVSTMAGPPIAGALVDSTNSYNSTFYFAGAMLVCAGLLFYAVPLTQKSVSLAHECSLCYLTKKGEEETEQSSEERRAAV